jgi:hypothetical protein
MFRYNKSKLKVVTTQLASSLLEQGFQDYASLALAKQEHL